MTWLILRVLTGHPIHVETKLNGLGLEAYCPRYTVRRRHPFHRRADMIDVVKPLFPGYLFASKPFDVLLINNTHLKARLMAHDGRYLTVSEMEMERVREAERRATTEWQPKAHEIISALANLVTSAGPQKFTRLADLQARKVIAA